MAQVFRLFISSTFQDWTLEREHLRHQVFPDLATWVEGKARELGISARFLPVDLRWGVSEEAAKTHATVDICLDEIRRCQEKANRPDKIIKPNFLLFLGQRYGWRPVPPKISQAHWRALSGLKVIDELFYECYEKDLNAVPSEWVLKSVDSNWQSKEAKLRKRLDDSFLSRESEWQQQFNTEELTFLVGSVTEQEVVRGAFEAKDAEKHVHVFTRTIKNPPADFLSDDEYISAKLLDRLKAGVKERGFTVHEYNVDDVPIKGSSYLKAFGEDVRKSLESTIACELEGLKESGDTDVVEAPDLSCFVDRIELNNLMRWDGKSPILLFGEAGTGKSTLLAKAAKKFGYESTRCYWIGRDTRCASGIGLLQAIIHDLHKEGYLKDLGDFRLDEIASMSYQKIESYVKDCLIKINGSVRLIIDAIDQLPKDDPARQLRWLAPNAPVLLSTLDEKQREMFVSTGSDEAIIKVEKLGPNESERLLDNWFEALRKGERTLQRGANDQIGALLREYNGRPLHLRVLFERAISLRSFDGVPDWLSEENQDTEDAIRDFYDYLARDEEHGDVMVKRTLAYLVSSPLGVSEDVLLALLRNDPVIDASFRKRASKDSPKVDEMPEVLWSRLYHDLEPFLARRSFYGEECIDFYHLQFRRVITQAGQSWVEADVMYDCRKRLAEMLLKEWNMKKRDVHKLVAITLAECLFNAQNRSLYELVNNDSFMGMKGVPPSFPEKAAWFAIRLAYTEQCMPELKRAMERRASEIVDASIECVAKQHGVLEAMKLAKIKSPNNVVEGVFAASLALENPGSPDIEKVLDLVNKLLSPPESTWGFLLDNNSREVMPYPRMDNTFSPPSRISDNAASLHRCAKHLSSMKAPYEAKASLALLALQYADEGDKGRARELLEEANDYVVVSEKRPRPVTKGGLKRSYMPAPEDRHENFEGVYYCLMVRLLSTLNGMSSGLEYIQINLNKLNELGEHYYNDPVHLKWLDELVIFYGKKLPFDYEGQNWALLRGVCRDIDRGASFIEDFDQLSTLITESGLSNREADEARLALCLYACGTDSWNIENEDKLLSMSNEFHSIAAYQCFWQTVARHYCFPQNKKIRSLAIRKWLEPYQKTNCGRKRLIQAGSSEGDLISIEELPIGSRQGWFDYPKSLLSCREEPDMNSEMLGLSPYSDICENTPPEIETVFSHVDQLLSNRGSVNDVLQIIQDAGLDETVDYGMMSVQEFVQSSSVEWSRKLELLNQASEIFMEGYGRDEFDTAHAKEFGVICMDLHETRLAKKFFKVNESKIDRFVKYAAEINNEPLDKEAINSSKALTAMADGSFIPAFNLIHGFPQQVVVKEKISLLVQWLKWIGDSQNIDKEKLEYYVDQVADELWQFGEYDHVIRYVDSAGVKKDWLLSQVKTLPQHSFSTGMIKYMLRISQGATESLDGWVMEALGRASSSPCLAETSWPVIEHELGQKITQA